MIQPEAFARLSLLLTAVAFGSFGTWLLVYPQAIGLVGVELPGASGRAEIRAFYGGMELGIAAFFVMAATRRNWFMPALALQVAALGGMSIGRVLGMAIDGGATAMHISLACIELAGAAVGVAALARVKRSAST